MLANPSELGAELTTTLPAPTDGDSSSSPSSTSNAIPFTQAALMVKQRLDILEVIGRHVALRKAGRNYVGLCPFHKEKSPSFNVNPSKQLFKCFGCNEGGDALAFLMKIDNQSYGEVIRELAREYGIDILDERYNSQQSQQAKHEVELLLQMHDVARHAYQQHLSHSRQTMDYLEARGYTTELQQRFGLGYAPASWDSMVHTLNQQIPEVRQQPDLLEKSGLANSRQPTPGSTQSGGHYDRFRNRLMIPILDDKGRPVAFGSRALSDEDQPKYLNSPETQLYVKSRLLYGLCWAKESIREQQSAVIMEGYFDVMSAHKSGVTWSVGVCGTALTKDHILMLKRQGAKTLYLCFDTDKAGQAAAIRAIEQIETMILDDGMQAYVVQLPDGKDPDDYFRHHTANDFARCCEQATDILTYKFDQALANAPTHDTSPLGRLQTIQAIVPLLVNISQPVVRQEFITRLALRIGVTEETLFLEVKRAQNKNQGYFGKKNNGFDAISNRSRSYLKGKQTRGPAITSHLMDDANLLKSGLSLSQSIAKKERELVSLMLLSPLCYELVMNVVTQDRLFESPDTQALLAGLTSVVNATPNSRHPQEWSTVLDNLQLYWLENQQVALAHMTTECLFQLDSVIKRYNLSAEGLHSSDYREKMIGSIDRIAANIKAQRDEIVMLALAKPARPSDPILPASEQPALDESALDAQLQLREALRQRKQVNLPPASPAIETPVTNPTPVMMSEPVSVSNLAPVAIVSTDTNESHMASAITMSWDDDQDDVTTDSMDLGCAISWDDTLDDISLDEDTASATA